MNSHSRTWSAPAMAAILLITAFAIYWPAIHGQFIWDDADYVTANPFVRASDGLYRLWFTAEPIDYWPVTNSMYWLEWHLWGIHPSGYHVVSILLHASNALLFWLLLQRLAIPGATLAALLFVVHPLNAESVAWIAEGKNTLSLFFALLSTLAFINRRPDPGTRAETVRRERPQLHRGKLRNRQPHIEPPLDRRRWHVVSILCFAAAMLSKGSVAMFPGILLALIWWRRGRITWSDVRGLLPFALIAIGLTVVNIWFQTRHVSTALRDVTMLQRILGAGAVVWFYLFKALLPLKLAFVYPQWHIRAGDLRWWLPLLIAVGVTVLLWSKRHTVRGRSLLFAWAVFCLALVPVMGLTDAYFMRYSLVADRYAYIALLPVVAAVAAGLSGLSIRTQASVPAASARSRLLTAIGIVLAAVLGIATWRQSHVYADAQTLWKTTQQRNPECWLCETNLAVPLVAQGAPDDLKQAIAHLEAAIRMNPDAAESHDGLGVALQKAGRLREAVKEHERAIALNPGFAVARRNLVIAREQLGVALAQAGRYDEAADMLRLAVRDAPGHAKTHRDLAAVLLESGRTDESFAHLQEAIRLDPSSAENHDTLARLLQSVGRKKEAIAEYREAVRLAPNDADWHNNLGAALLEDDQLQEAAHEFRESIRCNPRSPNAHRNLGVTLAEMDQLEEAAAHLREALRLDPSFDDARMNLNEVIARMRTR